MSSLARYLFVGLGTIGSRLKVVEEVVEEVDGLRDTTDDPQENEFSDDCFVELLVL